MASALPRVADIVIQGIFPWCFTPEIFKDRPVFVQHAVCIRRDIGGSEGLEQPDAGTVLGQRVDALSVRPIVRRLAPWTARPKPVGVQSMWFRIAHSVMRRPLVYALGIVTILLVLGSPFLRITFGGIDEQALPAGTESRVVAETSSETSPVQPRTRLRSRSSSPEQPILRHNRPALRTMCRS
jgi:hypothetical protein